MLFVVVLFLLVKKKRRRRKKCVKFISQLFLTIQKKPFESESNPNRIRIRLDSKYINYTFVQVRSILS